MFFSCLKKGEKMARSEVRVYLRTLLDSVDLNDNEFFKLIISTILEEGIADQDKLARVFDCSIPTIQRWASGKSVPPSGGLRSHMYSWLAEMLDESK